MDSEMCIIKYVTYKVYLLISNTKFDILNININYPNKSAKYENYEL